MTLSYSQQIELQKIYYELLIHEDYNNKKKTKQTKQLTTT